MKLITDVKLRKKEYLEVNLGDDHLVVLKDGKEIGRVKKERNVERAFMNNRNPKVAVKGINKDGSYDLVLVRWADLHGHTEYSLLDGAARIKDKASKTEYVSAITDHGNMFGIVEFTKAMEAENKHAIIGMEGYVETLDGKRNGRHIVLLAKDEIGYKNLVQLSSKAYENFYYKPHITWDMLREHYEGLIATSACLGGEIQQHLIYDDYESAKKVAKEYKAIFGSDFYLEIQRHGIGFEEDKANDGLIKLSKELNIPLVAGIDSHYTNIEDKAHHEILLCLQTGKTLDDKDRMTFSGSGYHIHNADEVDELFKDIPEALDNTLEIAKKCNFELDMTKLYMPEFDIPEGYTQESYLEEKVMEGFEERFKNHSDKEREIRLERVKHELSIINGMGFPSYFLIVWDIVKYAKDNGIFVGPGRGSAVGSIVSYCLNIVDIDPLDYGLLFERFLNPERVTMPDIDIDFCYERRGEVIQYMNDKYGSESVSRIVTQTTFGAKSVVRDVTRVLNKPYSVGDKIAKAIPFEPGITLEKAYEESPEFRDLYNNDREAKEIINISLKIEGLPKNTGVHACGIVVAPGPVRNYLPEFLAEKDGIMERTSQVVMTEVEELGLLKMDILGLKTMTVLDKTIQSIVKTTNDDITYDGIPINDPYVYRDIAQGKTYGVFQIEGSGMRDFMKKLYADVAYKISAIEKKYGVFGTYRQNVSEDADVEGFNREMEEFGNELFERLIAGISLYRPGPMDYIPNYLEGMNDSSSIKYITPELEPILSATYGVVVYQEQVMQIVQELGGFSLGEADLLRRVMGKKLGDDAMNIEKNKFIYGVEDENGEVKIPGCVRNGISAEIAEEIWHMMENFNKYAFNKSHSAGYAFIAIKTAFLKYYYPADFMASTLSVYIESSTKVETYLAACRDMNLKVLPPRINRSYEVFTKSGNDILFGLGGIKNISAAAENIVKEREMRGAFESVQDFAERMAKHFKVDKRIMDGLIYSGAFDDFGFSRNALIEAREDILEKAKHEREAYNSGQRSIFDIVDGYDELITVQIKDIDEWEKTYKLEKEKEYTGYYLSEHPLDEYSEFLSGENITEAYKLKTEMYVDEGTGELVITESEVPSGEWVKMAAIISEVKVVYTKRDQKPMAILTLEDKTGTMNAVIFPRQYEDYAYLIYEGNILLFEGTYTNEEDRGSQLIIDTVLNLDQFSNSKQSESKIININAFEKEQLIKLNQIITFNKGDTPVYVRFKGKELKAERKIKVSSSTMLRLERLFGSSNIKIVSLDNIKNVG